MLRRSHSVLGERPRRQRRARRAPFARFEPIVAGRVGAWARACGIEESRPGRVRIPAFPAPTRRERFATFTGLAGAAAPTGTYAALGAASSFAGLAAAVAPARAIRAGRRRGPRARMSSGSRSRARGSRPAPALRAGAAPSSIWRRCTRLGSPRATVSATCSALAAATSRRTAASSVSRCPSRPLAEFEQDPERRFERLGVGPRRRECRRDRRTAPGSRVLHAARRHRRSRAASPASQRPSRILVLI
jgi:hypothetical protein